MKESIYVIYGWVETLIRVCGVEGSAVPVVRHAVMAVVAGLLAFISYVLCRRLIVPAVMKITTHTKAKWDDALLVLFRRLSYGRHCRWCFWKYRWCMSCSNALRLSISRLCRRVW